MFTNEDFELFHNALEFAHDEGELYYIEYLRLLNWVDYLQRAEGI